MDNDKIEDKDSNKKVSSIAHKINLHSFISNIKSYIFFDILLIFLSLFIYCYSFEAQVSDDLTINANRRITYDKSSSHIMYIVEYNDEKKFEKDITPFINNANKVAVAIISFEMIGLLFKHIKGYRYIKNQLKPLDDIANTADRISSMAFDEEKMQTIEEAISNISPTDSAGIHIRDSELKGIEDSINKLIERIRDSYRQQARFVSDASHELRTPIAVIEGYANMLGRWGKEDEKVLDESIEAIKSESHNMKNLVEQLLFLARGINGKTKVNLSEFSLTDMVNEVYEESMMIDENHIYKCIKDDDINIKGDRELLKQTTRILVENAKKYTKEKEVIIIKAFINNNNEAAFSISDNGIGISHKDVSHIFERFFRADSARDRKTGGTGLGLSIAKWIIDKHNGYFEILSREEVGTKFIVNLPGALLFNSSDKGPLDLTKK